MLSLWLEWGLALWAELKRSYGLLAVLLALNAYQLSVLGWLGSELIADVRRRRVLSAAELQSVRQFAVAIWQAHAVYVKGVSLLGPALGLLTSTLFSAVGILEMGEGLQRTVGATESVGRFMSDVGLSYVLLVVATAPLVTGVAAVMLSQPLISRSITVTKSDTAIDLLRQTVARGDEGLKLLGQIVLQLSETAELQNAQARRLEMLVQAILAVTEAPSASPLRSEAHSKAVRSNGQHSNGTHPNGTDEV